MSAAILTPKGQKGNILDLYGSVAHRGKMIDFKKMRENLKAKIAKKVKK